MPAKKRRRVEGDALLPSWAAQGARRVGEEGAESGDGGASVPEWADQDARRAEAGTMLYRLVFQLYVFCRMSAKDLAILMYWIHRAGVKGEFQQWGIPPQDFKRGSTNGILDK